MKKLTPYQQKAIDFSKHISLTANAGSGKTFVLANRFVEIAVNQDIPLNSIIAITFTEKAAGELYKKISEEIELRLKNDKSQKILHRLEEIRRQLVSANISTIHSFCLNVLKEFSPEAGIDAGFLPADTNKSNELIELSIEELFKYKTENGELDDRLKILIRYFGSKRNTAEALSYLLKNRKNIQEIEESIFCKSIADISAHFSSIFNDRIFNILPDLNRLIESVKIINNKVKIKIVNEFTINVDEALNLFKRANSIAEKIQQIIQIKNSVLTQKNSIRKRSYISKNIEEELSDYIDIVLEFYSEFNRLKFSDVDFTLGEDLARFGKLVLEIFNQVLSIYEQKKKDQSLLDFEDILIKAKDVIKNQSVRDQLNEKYKYIMVDEYQDTNEIQYNIIMPILKYLNTGNLFIVGDEKQSIYRFRDAEPEIFRKTTTQIVKSVNESSDLNLPHSFRVSPPIAFFVNTVFKELFKNHNPEYNEVKYDELLCARSESETGKIEILLHDEENEDETESTLLAKKIINLCCKNPEPQVKYGDIAILCRKRASFSELEKAFSQYKIPYAISGGKGFFQRQSIYDIFSFISFVLNPDDDIALSGILRSPFFSMPDTVLFEISLKQGKTFFKKFMNYANDNNEYQKIISLLTELIDFSETSSIVLLLRKMLDETGYWSTIAAKKNAGQELANIDKLIQTANTYSHIGFKTLYDFKEYLDDAIKRVEDESQSPINDEDNSVKIMTVHQSKGLEFDTVFLYKCNETTMTEAIKSKAIYIDKEFGILAKIPKDENYFNNYRAAPIVSIYNYVVTRKSKAELKRLLYVAITRAKNNLFITASHKKFKFKEDSFIKLLASGLKTDFSENYVSIVGKLNFMKSAEENYTTYYKNMAINIPIIVSLKSTSVSDKSKERDGTENKKILAEKIFDMEKEEIVSATKIAYFNQCPIKYQLTYEYGYSKLLRLINLDTSDNSEDFREETNEYLPADIKGRIVHAILERETEISIVRDETKKLLLNEFQILGYNDELIKSYSEEIYTIVQNYYSSNTYKEVKRHKNYKNEFEIYLKVNDYYLYGIIDKIIIEKDELIIVDYKTDNTQKNKITKKAENYIPQLFFYSFIANNIYSNIKKIRLKLIFLNEPDYPFEKNVSSDELNQFGITINNIIEKIRLKEFSPNLNHCRSCHLSDENNKCPVK